MVDGEIKVSKDSFDTAIEDGRHLKTLNQNYQFHKEKLKQDCQFHKEKLNSQKEYNEKRLDLERELDRKRTERHDKTITLTKWLVIANIFLVIVTGILAWTGIETMKLTQKELLGDFDFKVTTTPSFHSYKGVDVFITNRSLFPHDLRFNVEVFNSGKTPLKLNGIQLLSNCFESNSMQILSTRYYKKYGENPIIKEGDKIGYDDFIATQYFKKNPDFPCEIIFQAHTNKLIKSVKIIIKE